MEPLQTKEAFIELRAKGLSFDSIAKELNVSKQTLINWSRKFRHQIDNLASVEMETLYEKYYLLKRERIKLFGDKLDAIKSELEKRALTTISTEKLLDLFPKYFDILKQEYTILVVKSEDEIQHKATEESIMGI